jgi:acyl-CoA synthetase
MIHEVSKEDLDFGEVPLGKLLDETTYAFQPDLSNSLGLEEMILTSNTRICFVDDKRWDKELGKGHLFAQSTGDIVRRTDDKIFFYGRRNDIVKKFGERVNLNKIESVAQKVIQSVACIYMKKKIVLFYKIDDHHLLGLLTSHLKENLKPSEVPDDFRKISFFPLSEHGKVSKQQLKDIYKDLLREDREKRIEAEEGFLEAINQILNLQLGKSNGSSSSDEPDGKRMRTDLDSTFKALGGTSFDALRISMRLEDQTGLSNGLLPKLLGDRHSIRDICHYLKDFGRKPVDSHTLFISTHRAITSSIVTEIVNRFDLKKCVDASPALVGNFISVGSHSHQLITVDAKTLKVVSETKFADRIESEVSMMGQETGLVGCYDGKLYCFDFLSGAIKWSFNSHGMIKSRALVVHDLVVFGNYNYEKNLWCLQVNAAGETDSKWNRLVGSRGILAAPLLINTSSAIICTLDGTIESISLTDGATIWSKKLESPIFSSPQIIPGRDEILIAEVSKKVHCIDFKGNSLWSFETEGHIFSSFLFHRVNDDEIKILFGCHDKKLRCLSYNHQRQSTNLAWSTELQSQIYGTPRMIQIKSENFVISCATNGFVNFLKLSNGAIEHSHKLAGEIFSTPVVHERILFVGCRDNFLYCIKF